MMNKMDERIVCVRANSVNNACKEGILNDTVFKLHNEELEHIMKHAVIMRRGDVEDNPCFKQIIPYGILIKEVRDSASTIHYNYLSYRRTKSGGDGRLHGVYSIGFGGHMREGEKIADCLVRELNEELLYDGEPGFAEFICLSDHMFVPFSDEVYVINDNSSSVNSVHFGVIFPVSIDIDKISPNEDTISELECIPYIQLTGNLRRRYESWSQLVIDMHIR